MKAKVSYWSMSYDGMIHTWTKGKDYEIEDNGDTMKVQSDGGTQEIPKDACNPDLFLETFGVII